jgi:hypothetical protein
MTPRLTRLAPAGGIALAGALLTVLTLLTLLAPRAARAQLAVGSPRAVFGPGPTLTGYTFTVGLLRVGPLPIGSTVSLQYQTAAGAPIGAPFTATVGAGGNVLVPPGLIPPAATPLGNRVVVSHNAGGGVVFVAPDPIAWYNSAWFGVKPAIRVDPLGIPGLTAAQTWAIDEPDLLVAGTSAVGGPQLALLTASRFDVTYAATGADLFDAFIAGDESFMQLDDGTYIAFPDGLRFGSVAITANDGVTAGGSFSFGAIGLAGTWAWLAGTNATTGVATAVGTFAAPAIRVVPSAVPEPSAAVLLVSGLVAAAITGRARKTAAFRAPRGAAAPRA